MMLSASCTAFKSVVKSQSCHLSAVTSLGFPTKGDAAIGGTDFMGVPWESAPKALSQWPSWHEYSVKGSCHCSLCTRSLTLLDLYSVVTLSHTSLA